MPTMSIVIPAHNEEAVIGRLLQHLLADSHPGELDIVVACNGCTDRTADIASSYGESVRVVHTSVASKTEALNLGDKVARCFPRFYIDADVVVSIGALREAAEVLRRGPFLAASPAIAWDLTACNWFVRSFYAVWQRQPYFENGRLGAGLYGLSAEGHARIGFFPPITADDEYVRRHFAESERTTLAGASFLVTPPRTLRDLVKVKTRSRRGTRELVQKFPHLVRPPRETRSRLVSRIAVRPNLWPAIPVYLGVVALTWLRSRRTNCSGNPIAWERDMSSRSLSNA